MRLLIDTHIFLWWDQRPGAIARSLYAAIDDEQVDVIVSAVSIWEIAIKRAIRKLRFPAEIVPSVMKHGFEILPISGAHAERAGALPLHHRDPFDRLIVAQAALESMTLGTQDPRMRRYGVPLLGLG